MRSVAWGVMAAGGLSGLALGAACDEPIPADWEMRGSPDTRESGDGVSPDAPEIPTVEGPCPIADEVFTPFCTDCHEGTKFFPDLRAGALGYLAGAPSRAYPGETLVVVGNPASSLLYLKLTHATGTGALMPPDGLPDGALLDKVAAWISDGAKACDGVTVVEPVEPVPPEPGGTITFGSTPNGFTTTHPSWAEEGQCTSQQWWKYQGNTESSGMHPGQACIDCHTREHEGPRYSYAGTVFANVSDTDDCRGVGGVKVEILDADGAIVGTTTTNNAGNFGWKASSLTFRRDYRARLTFDGRTREMTLPQADSGDCNTCHNSAGTDGAPGRMVVP